MSKARKNYIMNYNPEFEKLYTIKELIRIELHKIKDNSINSHSKDLEFYVKMVEETKSIENKEIREKLLRDLRIELKINEGIDNYV